MKSATEIDVTKLPFNHFIGLKISNKSGYPLMLDNHYQSQRIKKLIFI